MLGTNKLSTYVAHKLSGRNRLYGGEVYETDTTATGDSDGQI